MSLRARTPCWLSSIQRMSFSRRDCGDTLAGKGMARRPVENSGRKRTCHNADVSGKVNAQEWCIPLRPHPVVLRNPDTVATALNLLLGEQRVQQAALSGYR